MNLTTTIAVTRRLASAVASLVAIGALVVGVPFLLWRLAGWPLPGGLPSTSGIRRALTRDTVSDAALVKSIALVGWIITLASGAEYGMDRSDAVAPWIAHSVTALGLACVLVAVAM